MLHELQPLGLVDSAKRLGLDPFELVQLLVATDGVPKDMVFSTEQVDGLIGKGGVESGWWDEATLPEGDKNPKRQRVRAALGLLLDRGHVGGAGTRADNLWRGLSSEDQMLVRDAVLVLVDEGLLDNVPAKSANNVTVSAEHEARVRDIVEGRTEHSALSALYEG